jgi:beta-lactamase class A
MRRALAVVVACCVAAGTAALDRPKDAPVVTRPGTLAPQERLLWERLAARVGALCAGLDGVAGVSVKDLRSGATLEHNAMGVFPTASVIKLAVLYELLRQADAGRIALDEVTRPPLPRVGGGGALELLGGDVSLTWRDLATLMMALSDNAATNALIDRLGLAAIDARLRELDLPATRLRRRMLDLDAARRGDENVSSAADLARLMELLRSGHGLTPGSARELLRLAALPKSSPFRRGLPENIVVVDKPGDLEGVRAVAALVELPERPYVVTVMTGWLRRDTDGDEVIAELSRAVFETFDRLARASEYGRRLR